MRAEQLSSGSKAWVRAGTTLSVFVIVIALVVILDPDNLFLWIKAFHIIAVIAWMAGLLYLPRLFIYHFETRPGSESSELFKVMERRLLKIIMNPAMMLTWVLGLYMAWSAFAFQGGWLHAKLLLVVLLTGVHVYYSRAQRAFLRDERPKSQRHWRIMNEAPAVLMIAIVLIVVLKPF
ncbi:MAG: hypothetical protein JWM58_1256 [Rhizobium sp.]|nr:hypothetical protein [Rhizobium sp.]